MNRRRFLGLASLSALGVGASRTLGAIMTGAEADADARRAATAGVRWAMAVDTVSCRQHPGCTRCMAACHATHNVPSVADEARAVKWVWKERYERAFPSERNGYVEEGLAGASLPVLCNHCDRPPCTRVCPTKATWKRDDGVVMMDWHRCIGCRYCMAACPYGSRSFNWSDPRPHIEHPTSAYPTRTKGVVEKCTFCDERIARGQVPACVDACPHEGLIFGSLADPHSVLRQTLRARHAIRRKPELGTGPAVYYLV